MNAIGNSLRWLWGTSEGQWVRIAAGVTIFAGLAALDLVRHGRQATRWREYLFLLTAVAAAIGYALVNDMVTVTISPLYFVVHEGLASQPPHIRVLAATVAVKGSWWVGLLLGTALLIANNPGKDRPQLPARHLYAKILHPILFAGGGAALLGLAAGSGGLDNWLAIEPAGGTFDRPFMIVFYAHLGAYLAGALGGLTAVVATLRQRRRQTANTGSAVPKRSP